jgi:serine phosphatase RsbU (regulator of sigma subunit)
MTQHTAILPPPPRLDPSLPRGSLDAGRFDLAWSLRPAQVVSGDFVVVRPLTRDRVFVLLADAMGHGPAAHAIASGVQRRLQQLLHAGHHAPAPLLEHLHATVTRDFPDTFVTAACGIIDAKRQAFIWSAAGHPPMLLRAPDGQVDHLHSLSGALGLDRDDAFTEQTVALLPGSALLLYSDGITDALAPQRSERYRRLTHLLDREVTQGARAIVRTITRTAGSRARRQERSTDDRAVLAVCFSCCPPENR